MKFRIIILILVSISCKTPVELSKSDCIKKLKSELIINWKFNIDSAYYQASDDFLQRIDTNYKFCLYNFSKDSVISILGKPTGGRSNSFEYLVSKPCAKLTKPGMTKCTYLRFYVDGNNNVSNAKVSYTVGTGQK